VWSTPGIGKAEHLSLGKPPPGAERVFTGGAAKIFSMPYPAFRWGCGLLSQKIRETRKMALTVCGGGAYIRLNNEGGAPLATPEFASKEASGPGLVDEIKRAA